MPAAAAPETELRRDPLAAYVKARTATVLGDDLRAARLLAALSSLAPADRLLARRAATAAISSGDIPLALSVARSRPVAALGLDARLLLVADALRHGRNNDALALVSGRPDSEGGFLTPLLRAWVALGSRKGDPIAILDGIKGNPLAATYAPEQKAFLNTKFI